MNSPLKIIGSQYFWYGGSLFKMGLGLTGAHMGCRRFGSYLDLLEFCKIFAVSAAL